MLSTFLEFMNRERALSFSAALCLLTVMAAALPGVFQEDDPFENTSLWEGAADLQTIEPALSVDATPGELGDLVDDPATIDQVPDLGLNLELDQEPTAESFVSAQSSPDLELDPGQLDTEPADLADVHLEMPVLEPEIERIDSGELTLGEVNSDLAPGEIVPEDKAGILEGPEISNPVSDQDFGKASDSLVDDPGNDSDTQVSQDNLLEPPAAQAQDESVYQGEFWDAPLTPELPPDSSSVPLASQDGGTDSEQGGQDLLALPTDDPVASESDLLTEENPQFEALPAQPYPEFDWSQAAPIPSNSPGVQNQGSIFPSQTVVPLFSSPQVVPDGYQAFAAGNPALGGEVELNPMSSLPLPGTLIWTDNPNSVLEIPNDGSVMVENPSSPMYSVVDGPSQLIENPNYVGEHETYESYETHGTYDSYEPVYETPLVKNSNAGMVSEATPCQIPEVSNYGWEKPQPMITREAPRSRCRLLSRFCGVLSRVNIFKLRSFRLCPSKRVEVCQNQCGANQCDGNQCGGNQCGGNRVSRGLLKNWFNRDCGCVRKQAAGVEDCSLYSNPGRRPVCAVTSRLFRRPNCRPLRAVGSYLVRPPTCNPAQGGGCSLFKRSGPPTRGLLSGFFKGDNTSS